jgi:hypothetical protein
LEEQLDRSDDPEAVGFSEQEATALLFAKRLCAGELLAAGLDQVRSCFSEQETVEVVAFSAWQFAGPTVLTSWGAESYKQDGKVVLDALPVRLAYADAAQRCEPLPPIPQPPRLSFDKLLQRAESRQSPAPEWLKFLSPHPVLPSAWGAMYEMLVEGGAVEARVKQLQRVLIAERFACSAWAPEESSSLLAAGVRDRERQAIRRSDYSAFSPRERAALHYAEGLLLGKVDDETFRSLRQSFTWSEIVELGFAVATQAGAARVTGVLPKK